MTVVHRITGYDKRSERLEREKDIPADLVATARALADAPLDHHKAAGAFPLSAGAGETLSAMLGFSMNFERYDWFVEPFEV